MGDVKLEDQFALAHLPSVARESWYAIVAE